MITAALSMLPNAPDPHAGVLEISDYQGDLRLDCEVLVVGSGPGGAIVAKELAEAGRDVVLLEEGPPLGKADFVQEAGESMQRTLREGGTRAARGNPITPTMQAIALGGGSLINSAICARPPAWIFDKWRRRTGIEGITREVLDPHFDRVEACLGVAPTPVEVQGERNHRFKLGCEALGMSCEPTWRNVQNCRGSAECFTGCRNGAKKSTDVTYVAAAIRAGARVYTSVRVERVLASGRRVTGIRGRIVEPFTWTPRGKVRVDAKLVVLAAGCVGTPVILLKSGIANSSGWVGRDLRFHPGLAVMAMFPEPIEPWKGATQGYHSVDYLKEGLKFEVLWSPPSVLATRLPGCGHAYQEHLLRYDRMAPFDVICAADDSSGSVRLRRGSHHPDLHWDFAQTDFEIMQKGLGILSDICWAAGAEAILPGLNGIPEVLRSRDEAELIRTRPLEPKDTITASNHAFCTTRMAKDPADGVVDEHGRCHDVDNLFIADTGIFAASSGVNPMLLCMALADRIALGIADRW
ncbi:MAG: GMC family oxidoreductase [Deltaproteobacteria bacterium]|nr:MAG: GMC family oxidoreductase [Deltaproteobacteria bacterium]